MMKSLFYSLLLLSFFFSNAQENPLAPFENLVGKTWVSEGKWGDGNVFKQETTFEYGLNEQIIIAKTKGFTNQEQTTFGDRNHGIRKYDAESGKVLFWEFDVFGGTTKGEVLVEDGKLLYVYEYGGSTLADVWEYVDGNSYTLKVASYSDGKVGQVYMQGTTTLKK